MIRRAFIIKRNGEPIYGRRYTGEKPEDDIILPPSIRACVILLDSSKSVAPASPYVLSQPDSIWVYCFFETFAVALEGTPDERVDWLKRRALSLGRHIVEQFSGTFSTWPGNPADIEGFNKAIDNYVLLDLAIQAEKILEKVEVNVDNILTKYPVAYAGVFDALGNMIGGNIPEDHIATIRTEILHDSVKSSIDLVPTTINVKGYDVHAIRVKTLTAVAAPYRQGSKLAAVQAVGDLAHLLEETIS
ncbi:MAG: hypothetical protein ACTSYL_11710 [Candidatus Thorarchaeota archaeon]